MSDRFAHLDFDLPEEPPRKPSKPRKPRRSAPESVLLGFLGDLTKLDEARRLDEGRPIDKGTERVSWQSPSQEPARSRIKLRLGTGVIAIPEPIQPNFGVAPNPFESNPFEANPFNVVRAPVRQIEYSALVDQRKSFDVMGLMQSAPIRSEGEFIAQLGVRTPDASGQNNWRYQQVAFSTGALARLSRPVRILSLSVSPTHEITMFVEPAPAFQINAYLETKDDEPPSVTAKRWLPGDPPPAPYDSPLRVW